MIIQIRTVDDLPYPQGGAVRFRLSDEEEWKKGYIPDHSTDFIERETTSYINVNIYDWQKVFEYEQFPITETII